MTDPHPQTTVRVAAHAAQAANAAFLALLLTACGGGTQPSAAPGDGNQPADAGAPQVTALQIGAPVDGQVTLRAVATDDVGVSGICFRSDATAPDAGDACFQDATETVVTVPSTHQTWRAYARDAAGHVSAPFERLLDLQAPVVTALAPLALAGGQVKVRITASDSHDVSAVCLRTDTDVPLATDACFTAGDTVGVAAAVGSASYRAYARDASGNVSAAFAGSLDAYAALDTGLPVVTGITSTRQPDGRYALTATARDEHGVSGVCFRTDAAIPAATDACFQADPFVAPAPATFQTYKVYARDNAGQVSSAFDHTLDVVPPVVQAAITTDIGPTLVTVRIDAQDAHGVSAVCLRLASESAPAASDACFVTGPMVTVGKPIDFKRYLAYARDAAGNVGAALAYTLDMATPSVLSVTASAPSNGRVTLTAKAVDSVGVTGFCLRSDETVPTAGDACFTAVTASQTASSTFQQAMPTTPTTYKVYARDGEGHVSVGSPLSLGQCTGSSGPLPKVCFLTSLGDFLIELDNVHAPVSSANVLRYVNAGFYDETQFHRIMSGFMVQGGGYTAAGQVKTPAFDPIALEKTTTTGLSNTIGTVAMARTSAANSATSQFFINVVNNASTLDGSTGSDGYAVFGRVIGGMDTTVQMLRKVPVQLNGSELSKPTDPPRILRATPLN
ncbi:peptidylprolyl isomerase [Leptothrix discophora]|uniref:peptidylprolyl isomerase n=1 Tax=Leptothrix discophora TaxID=89 RepID=A0ABT9G7W5_LEPDI|nr:peptidylprolyl isomerase [Leptothrix discophora]MDP4302486.1 peptidylprolyl isomerase [Leptothrix discophora]